jgi:hypothetical protein
MIAKKTSCFALAHAAFVLMAGAGSAHSMEWEGNSYHLYPNFLPNADPSATFGRGNDFIFFAQNLDPAFKTERFQCVIDNVAKDDGCKEWKNREREFIHVNTTKSTYGVVPAQRRMNEQNSSVGKAVGSGIGSAVVGTLFVVASPFIFFSKATEKQTTRWVEFNHDDFKKEQVLALKNFGYSEGEFLTSQSNAKTLYEELAALNSLALKTWSDKVKKVTDKSKNLQREGYIAASFQFTIRPFVLPEMPISRDDADFKESSLKAMEQYYANQFEQFLSEFESDYRREHAIYAEKIQQDQEKTALRHREDIRLQGLKQKELADLEGFRRHLKFADDTFCGVVLEVKYPLFKIALDRPLQGFPSEVWLKSAQIFPKLYGCRNVNGQLVPIRE